MAKKTGKTSQPADFEGALDELETLVERMEKGETRLEDALQDFERGIALTRTCQKALADAEQKVQILLEQNADAGTESFDQDD
ncbi:exodeoxyribonuclease VII small subunit [Sulfuriflexus sp.]|uniref:exodeoxyribonuclease VII small subunit n=1 Tax=Sulfuriflexus sp. TaxID=2015443 RepID=UPI0028CBFF9E|nr:exodeoxyribonuclease VII small subunit [Sulfuriflexus sp.]MDT8403271.1 exodeoxyribonuclease VII small subunit [Sulfuriflexus sp.]